MLILFVIFLGIITILFTIKDYLFSNFSLASSEASNNKGTNLYLQYMQEEHFEKAIQELIRLPNHTATSLMHLAECYQDIGDLEKSLATYLQVQDKNKYSGEIVKNIIFHKIAALSYQIGNIQQALEYYMQILINTPDDPTANKYVAYIAIGNQRFDIALPYIQHTANLDPNNIKNNIAYIITLYELKKNDILLKKMDEILHLFPKDPEVNSIYMLILSKLNPSLALEQYEKIIQIIPRDYLFLLMTRIFIQLSYHFSLENETSDFLLDVLNMFNDIPNDIRTEILYFIAFKAIKVKKYDLAKKLVLEIEQFNPIFKHLVIIKQEIYSRQKEEEGIDVPDFDNQYFQSIYEKEMKTLIPDNILYQISNLATNDNVSFDSFFDTEGGVPNLKKKYQKLDLNILLSLYERLSPTELLSFCEKTISNMSYIIVNKTKRLENNGYDFICEDMDTREIVIFCFKVWGAKANISDIFITNLVERTKEKKAKKTILISNASLTKAAEEILVNYNNIDIISGQRLMDILAPLLE